MIFPWEMGIINKLGIIRIIIIHLSGNYFGSACFSMINKYKAWIIKDNSIGIVPQFFPDSIVFFSRPKR